MFFADAESSFNESDFVIMGIEGGIKGDAPKKIREKSWDFESYNILNGVDLQDIRIHDFGNIDPKKLRKIVARIVKSGKFPIIIGGDHSITPSIVSGIYEINDEMGVILIDAHLDFREEYMGKKYSPACTTRRIAEMIGIENILVIGARSASEEEVRDGEKMGLSYLTSFEIKEKIDRLKIDFDSIYLSLDMDALNILGVRYPEPFGLNDVDVLRMIRLMAPRLIGMDVVEARGEDAIILGAKMIQECISWVALEKGLAGNKNQK